MSVSSDSSSIVGSEGPCWRVPVIIGMKLEWAASFSCWRDEFLLVAMYAKDLFVAKWMARRALW